MRRKTIFLFLITLILSLSFSSESSGDTIKINQFIYVKATDDKSFIDNARESINRIDPKILNLIKSKHYQVEIAEIFSIYDNIGGITQISVCNRKIKITINGIFDSETIKNTIEHEFIHVYQVLSNRYYNPINKIRKIEKFIINQYPQIKEYLNLLKRAKIKSDGKIYDINKLYMEIDASIVDSIEMIDYYLKYHKPIGRLKMLINMIYEYRRHLKDPDYEDLFKSSANYRYGYCMMYIASIPYLQVLIYELNQYHIKKINDISIEEIDKFNHWLIRHLYYACKSTMVFDQIEKIFKKSNYQIDISFK